MKAYLTVTGLIFGVLTLAHIARMFAEGARITADPVVHPRYGDGSGLVPLGMRADETVDAALTGAETRCLFLDRSLTAGESRSN